MEARTGPQGAPTASGRTQGDAEGPSGAGRRNRVGLWKAIAGMAATLALAGAIVAMEISSQLVHRTHHYSRRIVALKQTVRKLRREAEVTREHLAAAREEASERDRIARVLLAPDVATFRFVTVRDKEKAAATLKVSREAGGAVLSAKGLEKLKPGEGYEAWWVPKGATPAKAAEFRPSVEGSATVYLKAPPSGTRPAECVVTLADSTNNGTKGRVVMSARLSR